MCAMFPVLYLWPWKLMSKLLPVSVKFFWLFHILNTYAADLSFWKLFSDGVMKLAIRKKMRRLWLRDMNVTATVSAAPFAISQLFRGSLYTRPSGGFWSSWNSQMSHYIHIHRFWITDSMASFFSLPYLSQCLVNSREIHLNKSKAYIFGPSPRFYMNHGPHRIAMPYQLWVL